MEVAVLSVRILQKLLYIISSGQRARYFWWVRC